MIKHVSVIEVASLIGSKLNRGIKIVDSLATPEKDANILYSVAKTITPKFILEIGTFFGHTTYGFAVNSPNSNIYTIDIHDEMGIGVPSYQEIERLPRDEVGKIFKDCGLNIVQKFSDSRKSSTYYSLPKFDFVYIDGNHTAEAIILDTRNVFNKTNRNSIIFWHDYKDDGLVETKTALSEIMREFNIKIFHIKDTWLAFTIKNEICGFSTEHLRSADSQCLAAGAA